METILFSIFATGGILSAILMVTRRNPIISAIYLIGNFFCLAGIYLTLEAQFIAVVQILVYAGAIMVLFVFVIMLLNLGDEQRLRDEFTWKKAIAGGLGIGVLVELVSLFLLHTKSPALDTARAAQLGTVESIGRVLFTQYLFPFEVTSLLLTVAIVGAILLAKKKID